MTTEIRAYLIKVEKDNGSDDYDDEEFMTLAEEQGTVMTLGAFQDWYNYEHEVNREDYYLRFLTVKM